MNGREVRKGAGATRGTVPPFRQRGMALLEFIIATAAAGLLVGGVLTISSMADSARETRAVGAGAERTRVVRDMFARDAASALSDSVRVTRLPGGGSRVEMVPVLGTALLSTGGSSALAPCPTEGEGDLLSFDVADSCLKTSGRAGLTALDNPPDHPLHLAVPGAGAGAFWKGGASGAGSRRTLGSVVLGSEEARLEFAGGGVPISRGDSSGTIVVVGRPVVWECDLSTGELRREEGVAWSETPEPGAKGAKSSVLMTGVTFCSFAFGDPGLWESTSLLLSFDKIELIGGTPAEPPPEEPVEGESPSEPVDPENPGEVVLVDSLPPFDSSPRPKTVSKTGTVEQFRHDMNETFLGVGLGLFAGGYLTVPPSFELDPGADDFSVDLRIRTGGAGIILALDRDGGYGPLAITADDGGTLRVYASTNGTSWDVADGAVLGTADPAEWEHVAAVRSGGRIMGFLRGTKAFDLPVSGPLVGATAGLSIGAGTDGRLPWTGRADEIRIVRGRAAWTADFEPPTSIHAKTSSALSMRVEAVEAGASVVAVGAARPRSR